MLKGILIVFFLLVTAGGAKERFQSPGPVQLDHEGEKWADKTLKGLSLEQKIGQMLMMPAPSEFLNIRSVDYVLLRDMVQRFHLGGVVLTIPAEGLRFRTEPYEAAAWTNELQKISG